MKEETREITRIVEQAGAEARTETGGEPEPEYTRPERWPRACTVGPGLEGAIACDSAVGYVNGSKGWLIYRGYDIFDLCAHSSFEEVSYLLLHGDLPAVDELEGFRTSLVSHRRLNQTLRDLMSFPVQNMNTMAALRLGVDLMRQRQTSRDDELGRPDPHTAIGSDEDSIAMETPPRGEEHAIYEFAPPAGGPRERSGAVELLASYQSIAGIATIAGAISRLRNKGLPLEPDSSLSHAANFLYMLTGRVPTPAEERIMDISLILHADHGMNASTFASLVVASTLSDIHFSIGAGIAALNGPLHGGANELVIRTLERIGEPQKVSAWLDDLLAKKERVMGFGHRVYKAYDPRARILGPLVEHLARGTARVERLFATARELERQIVDRLGGRGIFPNVDFYSGLVYRALDIPTELFTPILAVSRVAGWCARIIEYLGNNRIFRPRAIYVGPFDRQYVAIQERA